MDKNIVLIGMPGCGKSTIGEILANNLDIEFCDVDKYIEEKHDKKISDIFKNEEEYFRRLETDAVCDVVKKCPQVISTGGGVVKNSFNIEKLKENGIIIFIDRPIENILNDVDISERPLLKDGKEKIISLYKERYPLYKKYCDYIVKNDVSIDEVVKRLVSIVKEVK